MRNFRLDDESGHQDITFRRAYKRTGNSNHALEANAGKRGKE